MEPIRFLFDENVRSDVVAIFEERGHDVVLARDVLATSSPDQLLALFGKYERLVIVSHDRDFKKYRAMLPEHERSRFRAGAGRLFLDVAYPKSPQRVAEELESIEFHYWQAQKRHKPFLMTILDVGIRVVTK